MKDIEESLNAMSGAKTLFGGQDSVEKSMIWCNKTTFALFIGTTSLNRLSRHPNLIVSGKS